MIDELFNDDFRSKQAKEILDVMNMMNEEP